MGDASGVTTRAGADSWRLEPAYPFVVDSWVSSYHETACDQLGITIEKKMDRSVVREYLRAQVHRLLGEFTLRIAYLEGDEDTFVGWVCGDPRTQTIHYVYVKSAWREQGIASHLIRQLVPAAAGRYTFGTHKHAGFMRTMECKGWRWRLLRP